MPADWLVGGCRSSLAFRLKWAVGWSGSLGPRQKRGKVGILDCHSMTLSVCVSCVAVTCDTAFHSTAVCYVCVPLFN
jgi:hypothetical protein